MLEGVCRFWVVAAASVKVGDFGFGAAAVSVDMESGETVVGGQLLTHGVGLSAAGLMYFSSSPMVRRLNSSKEKWQADT